MTVDAWIGVGAACRSCTAAVTPSGGTARRTLTLLAVGGPADGVRTEGLRYPLHGETLAPARPAASATSSWARSRGFGRRGTLLVVQPEALQ